MPRHTGWRRRPSAVHSLNWTSPTRLGRTQLEEEMATLLETIAELQAILADEFYIFTHPEWKRLLEPQVAEMLAAFGVSADPAYAGDDIDALLAANEARAFSVSVAR